MTAYSDIKGIRRSYNFKFSEFTTYGLGGKASVAYFPKTIEESCALFNYLKENKINYFVLGKGSNILAADSGFEGAIICTSDLNMIKQNAETLYCEAGVFVGKLLSFCKTNGLGGLEYLAGIPASIGGIIYMNGGAAGRHICESIKSVTVFDGTLHKLSLYDCHFGNKHSIMRDIDCLILSAELKINHADEKVVSKNIEQNLKRRVNQPKGRSCGCVFVNPDGLSAGKLIDECGLKGLKIGGAHISPSHANFIINDGGTAADVRALISETRRRVLEMTGIDLKEEVVYIGDFNDING